MVLGTKIRGIRNQPLKFSLEIQSVTMLLRGLNTLNTVFNSINTHSPVDKSPFRLDQAVQSGPLLPSAIPVLRPPAMRAPLRDLPWPREPKGARSARHPIVRPIRAA